MKDKYKFIDDAKREQDRNAGPTEEQISFANFLGEIGRWDLFWTFTFKPNQYEQIGQTKDREFTLNEKMRWCNNERRILKRVDKSTGIQKWGNPAIAPGWSKDAAMKQGLRFVHRNFKRGRWFMVAEGHKHRNCAHLHLLTANTPRANLTTILNRWQKQYGWADVEVIKQELGIAHYLCKGYVAKNYGKQDDLEFEFSHNCLRPLDQDCDRDLMYFKTRAVKFWRRRDGSFKHVYQAIKKNELEENENRRRTNGTLSH